MQSTTQPTMQPTTLRYLQLAWGGYIGLVATMSLWVLVFNNEQITSISFAILVYLAPLLFPLPGMLKRKPYTFAWFNFILLIYFTHASSMLYLSESQLLLAFSELFFTTIAFIGSTYYARLRGKELGSSLSKLSKVMADEKARFEK